MIVKPDGPLEYRGTLPNPGLITLGLYDKRYDRALESACEGWILRRLCDNGGLGRQVRMKDGDADLSEMTREAQHYSREFAAELRWEREFDVELTWDRGRNSTNIRCQIRTDDR